MFHPMCSTKMNLWLISQKFLFYNVKIFGIKLPCYSPPKKILLKGIYIFISVLLWYQVLFFLKLKLLYQDRYSFLRSFNIWYWVILSAPQTKTALARQLFFSYNVTKFSVPQTKATLTLTGKTFFLITLQYLVKYQEIFSVPQTKFTLTRKVFHHFQHSSKVWCANKKLWISCKIFILYL